MKYLVLFMLLVGCGPEIRVPVVGPQGPIGEQGAAGTNGTSPQLQSRLLETTATRGGPNFSVTISGGNLFVQVPQSVRANVPHSNGSPGWITITVANKTLCYQASSGSSSTGANYDLKAVRSGNDTSCTTGSSSNSGYNSLELTQDGSLLQVVIHTPRIANGVVVPINLNVFNF